MGDIGPSEILIIGLVLVLLFGATRLPKAAKGLGQALRIFRQEIRTDRPALPVGGAADSTESAGSDGPADPSYASTK